MPKLDIEFTQMLDGMKNKKTAKFATIDPNYVTGKPCLVFDGELTPTIKTFVYLASYTPVANDRVMVIQDVIVGKIMN